MKKNSFIKSSYFAALVFFVCHRGPMKLPGAIMAAALNGTTREELLYLLLYGVLSVISIGAIIVTFKRRRAEKAEADSEK